MSQFVSTMIDDESLIEELRRYGEPNLPTLPSQTAVGGHGGSGRRNTRSSATTANELNDTNREIYLKKLNHYRAKEKAKLNPSKQFKKQQQQQQQQQHVRPLTNQRAEADIIEIDDDGNPTTTTSEYIDMRHASTSPMGNGTLADFDVNDEWTHQPPSQSTEPKLEYLKLRERIELDKTLSRYRSDINNILSASNVRNRFHQSTATVVASVIDDEIKQEPNDNVVNNNDVVYTKTIRPTTSPTTASSSSSSSHRGSVGLSSHHLITPDDVVTQTHYCPKPISRPPPSRTTSLMDSIRSTFRKTKSAAAADSSTTSDSTSTFRMIHQMRNGTTGGNGNSAFNTQPLIHPSVDPRATYLTPKKETPSVFLRHLSNISIQLAKTLPYILLIIVVIIILQYLRVRYQRESTEQGSGEWSQTSSSTESSKSSSRHYCDDIKDPQCSATKLLVRELIDYLRYMSGRVDCSPLAASLTVDASGTATSSGGTTNNGGGGDTDAASLQRRVFIEKCVHINRVVDYLVRERGLIWPASEQVDAIDSVLLACLKNPHWDVHLLNSTYAHTDDLNQVTYLMSSTSYKSVTCRFKELAHFLYVRAVMLVSIVLVLALVYAVYTAWRNVRNERERAFYQLVARVTEHVEKQYELATATAAASATSNNNSNIKPYVPIAHVYAAMFEASERASPKTAKLWQRVCKFIQDHESRIHVEAQFVDGEETLVWRWVAAVMAVTASGGSKSQSPPPNAKSSAAVVENRSATEATSHQAVVAGWQGDAFDRSERPLNSPTPCLKVRNMFDLNTVNMDPNFHIKIHNDILEKCCSVGVGSGSGFKTINNKSILHIACDKRSKEGCVYIKCASNEAAGKVYQALNGTWYSGKLLNVKFLRADRYVERYPDSVNYTSFLQLLLPNKN